MAAKVYYEKDADLKHLKGKTVAILGYGSQGHAQALNLRDSGVSVVVSEIRGTDNHKLAVKHGFKPVDAAEAAALGPRHGVHRDALFPIQVRFRHG